MELESMEAILEKIWDLHDKLSDAIHSISRAHFLNSMIKSDDFLLLSRPNSHKNKSLSDSTDNHRTGYVFAKDEEAKRLNDIRTALENLEDQLEVFHTVQRQQWAERDAAVAHLEQSRIVLAMRLAEHQGKRYTVIEEARAFAGDVRDTGRFGSSAGYPSAENFVCHRGWRSNFLVKVVISSFNFAKRFLKGDGILGSAALVAMSMLAFLHLVAVKDKYILGFPPRKEDFVRIKEVTKVSQPEGFSVGREQTLLDVLLARG